MVEILSNPKTNGFVIANIGGLDLTLNDPSPYVEITGDTGDFTLGLIPSTPIEPISATRFEIIFNPQSIGVKSAVISIANNDSEKDPYTFAIKGEGFIPESEIAVLGDGIFIENGDITPREADGTDYRNIEVNGTSIAHTFSITNNGDIDLVLYNNPIVELSSGTNFNLLTPPASTISPNDGTTFTVVFDPIEPGQHTTSVSIANNDEDESPYLFDITGFGILDTYCGVLDTIDIPPSTSYYISNVTTDIINNTTVFEPGRYSYYPSVTPDYVLDSSNDMSVTMETVANEQIGVTVWIDYNNDGDFLDIGEEIYTDLVAGSTNTSVKRDFSFTIPEDAVEVITWMRVAVQKGDFPLPCGPFTQPGEIEDYLVNIVPVSESKTEIELVGNGVTIFNGDVTPSSNNDTYFGSIDVESGVESHTFTIKNTGSLDLILNGDPLVELVGDTDNFSVTTIPTTPILAGSSTTFTIAFDPTETGEKSVVVELLNNDSNENPYSFRIQGTGKLLNDNDGDLVVNELDLDNDNDGILNVEENSDCSNTVAITTTSLFEDFGSQSLENGTPSVSSPYLGSYEYLPLEVGTVPTSSENSLTANRYSVFNNIQESSSWAGRSAQTIGDHTNGGNAPSEGRMLMINTNQDLNSEYYRRDLTEVEVGVPVDISIWVMNLDTDIPDNEGRILPNLEVIIEQGGDSFSVISTGGIPRVAAGDTSAWKNFSGSYIPTVTDPITMVIVDRAALGNGNEFALDDILVKQTQSICDVDGDGIPNEYDLDSDNDGIYDVVEAGGVDVNNNGLADDDNDNTDNTLTIGVPTSAGEGLIPITTEGSHADYIDYDSDEDGCTDAKEAYGNLNAEGDDDGQYGEGIPEVLSNGTVSAALYITPIDNDENTVADYIQLSETIVDIIRSPFDAVVLEGTNVILSVEVETEGEGREVSYRWQENQGDGFEDLVNDDKYSGVDTFIMRIENVTREMTGYTYRVVVESESYICDEDLISDEAELIIKTSDLVTEKSVDNINPYVGDEIIYSIIVSNLGPNDATNVSVVDLLPIEVTYIQDNSSGDYNPVDGLWTIGNLSAGSSETLFISALVNNVIGTVRNQITQVSLSELDLTSQGDILFADFIVNDIPTAVADAVTVAEDSGITNIDVTTNDAFGEDGPLAAPIELVSGSTLEGGTVFVNDNGTVNDPTDDTIDYEPKLDFYGTDTFDYKIYDSDNDESVATVTVTVTSVNDVPTAVDDPLVSILEDSVDEIVVVLENDDFGGDGPGAFVLATMPANGTAVIDDRGTPEITDDVVLITPTLDYFGADSFTYTITDTNGDESTATVTITVTPVDDEPVAEDDTATTNEDVPLNIDVLVNDDFGGDGPSVGPIEVVTSTTEKGGTVVVNENGTTDDPTDDTIDYTPKLDFNGTDTFDYAIHNVDGDISAATVTVTVNPVNDVPTAVDDALTILEDDPATTIPVTYNDDFGGDGPSSTAIVIAVAPVNGVATVDDNATATDPTDDRIVYTPNSSYNGVEVIDYTITDSNGDTSTATLTITVEEVNDLPAAVSDTATVAEDSGVTNIDVTTNDDFGGDGASATPIELVSGSTLEGGTVVVNENGTSNNPTDDTIDYEPKLDFNGTDSFDYKIYDSNGDVSVATVTVTVTLVNDVPTAGDDNVVIVEDRINAQLFLLNNDDFGGDGPGTFTLTALPSNGTATIDDRGTPDVLDDVVTYSPTPDYNGPDVVTYTITDSNGDASVSTVTIEVTPLDDLPLANPDTATTDEDIALNIDVLINDDFGGDGPSTGPIELPSPSSTEGGTVVVNDGGTENNPTDDTIDYTPATDFNGLDSFDYIIKDSDGSSSTATVTITVDPVNDVPVAVDDSTELDEDDSATIIPVAYNDDFGGDGPSITAIVINTGPTNGTATVDDNTTPTNPTDDRIVYTPNADYNGPDMVVYTITDIDGDTSDGTLSTVVNSVNDEPTAADDTVITDEDVAVNIDVLVNDNFGGDGQSDGPIQVVGGTTAKGGTVIVNDNTTPNNPSDDTIDYTHKADFNGEDTFQYKILDIDGDESVATVTITVNSVNDVPAAENDVATTVENSPGIDISVLSNDDFGGDGPSNGPIELPSPSSTEGGTVVVKDNGTPNNPLDDYIEYTPISSYDGPDSFTYTIEDVDGDASTATVNITVSSVDVDPIASNDTFQIDEDSGLNNFLVLANDDFGGNGPSITTDVVIKTTPLNGTAVVNNGGTPNNPADDSVDYTPSLNFNGSDTFEYTIADSDEDTSTALVTITVLPVNDLPTAGNEGISVLEDSGVTSIDVTDNDDFGGDGPSDGTIILSGGNSTEGGIIVVNDGGTPNDPTDDLVDYSPALDFNGADTFTYTITDSNDDISTATVTVTVTPVDDVPVAKNDLEFIFEDDPLTTFVVTSNDDFGGDGPSVGTIRLITSTSANNGVIAINDGGTPSDPTDDRIDYTPFANFNGSDSFDYEIEDADGDTSIATVLIEVVEVNDLPDAVDDAVSLDEDSIEVRIDVLVNDDFGGDGPNTGSITLPQGAVTGQDNIGLLDPTINDGLIVVDDNDTPNDPTDDTILYTPAPNYNGTDSFDYTITDSNGDTSTATVTLTINSIDDLPVAELDFVASVEDSPMMTIPVTANDDFGGDGSSTTAITISGATTVAGGSIVVNDGGTPDDPTDDGIDYIPLPNYNGDDSFEYTIADSDGDESTATVIVYLESVNDLPTAVADGVTVDEDSGLTSIVVTANDDFGGDGPSEGAIVLVSGNTSVNSVDPTSFNGSVTVNNNGTPDDPTDDLIDYTPALDFNGTDTFNYRIEDSDGDISEATVTVTVTSVNDLPLAQDDLEFVLEDSELITIGVTVNDDFGGDGSSTGAIILPGVSSANGGTIAVNDNGTPDDPTDDGIDYKPFQDYFGLDDFTYTIEDSNGDSSIATVLVEVISVNDLPTAVDDAITVDEDSEDIRVDVLINDNFGGDGPSEGSITLPEGAATGQDDTGLLTPSSNDGLITVDDNGTPNDPTDDSILYSPAPDYNGSDSFLYAIEDFNGDITQATVYITVNPINDLPQAEVDFLLTQEDAPLTTIPVTSNDDFGGDGPNAITITISGVITSGGGTIAVNDNGTPDDPTDDGIDYTPLANYFGNDSFEYTITDSNGDTSTASVFIYLDSVNDLPTANDDSVTVEEDSGLTSIVVTANDDFGGDGPSEGAIVLVSGNTSVNSVDPTSFNGSVTVNNNGTPDDPTDDLIDYVPSQDFNGTDTFNYSIEDSDGDFFEATVTITVTPVNDFSMAEVDFEFVLEDSGLRTIDVTANDDFGGDGPKTGTITLSDVSSNNGADIAVNDNGTPDDPTDDGIDYTPFPNFNGLDEFTYTIADSNDDTSTAIVYVEVIEVNDLPTAVDDAITVDEDSQDIRIAVLVNDDFGGDGPSEGSITLPEGAVTGQDDSGLATPSSNDGLITVDDNGTPTDPTDDAILYSPAPDYNGPDSFIYAITDSNGDVSQATVNVIVNSINDLPKAEIDFLLTEEDAPFTTINVTVNDNFGGDGPSTGAITISGITTSGGGTISVNGNGTPDDPTDDGVDYTPAPNYNGNDSFEYTIADSNGDTSTTPVFIYIDSVNDLPLAVDDNATVDEDSDSITIDVTINDDFGGDGPAEGTIILVSGNTSVSSVNPSSFNGTVVVNDNGTPSDPTDDKIDYTPAIDFNGEDSFDYRIEDSNGDTSEAVVKVFVAPRADIHNDWFVTNEDESVVVDVLSNDDDIPPASVLSFTTPFGGVIDIDNNGTEETILDDIFTYVPFEDYNGIELFSYEICDGVDCVSADVLISINPKIDIENDTFLMREGTKQALDLYANDNDIPNLGDIMITFPSHGILEVDSSDTPNNPSDDFFVYTPNPDFVGIDSFTYTICDSDNPVYCETGIVLINVVYAGSNDDYVLTLEDQSVDIFFLENDLKIPSNGNVSFDTPTNGSVVISDNGTPLIIEDDFFIYTPLVDYNGEDSFIYTVCDTEEFCTSAMITITVEPVVDAFDDMAETDFEMSVAIDVLANDNDVPDEGTLTFTNPTSGSVTIENYNGPLQALSTAHLVYNPNSGFSGTDSFEYTVCDTRDPNNCSSAMVTVTVLEDPIPPRFTLPNEPGSTNKGFGFSPNNDGINDVLRIHSYDGEVFVEEVYPNFKVEIFNRWGDMLYEYKHNGNPNSPQPGWDGISQGKRTLGDGVLPVGTYFYTLYFNDGIRQPYSGWIYLSK